MQNQDSQSHASVAVDDSEVVISSRHHTMLAAVYTEKPKATADALEEIRSKHGILEEFKWSGFAGRTPEEKRNIGADLLPILGRLTGFIVICEGRDKFGAARTLAAQLGKFLKEGSRRIDLRFDEGIISNTQVDEIYGELGVERRLVSIKSCDSKMEPLIQIADLFVGYHKLAIDFAFGRRSPIFSRQDDFDLSLSRALHFMFRYSLWGAVPGDFSNDDEMHNAIDAGTYPIKYARNFGLVVNSSIDCNQKEKIYEAIGTHWLGCIH